MVLVCLLLLCYLCIISDNFVSAESECPQKLPHVVPNCSAEDGAVSDMKCDDGSTETRNVVAECLGTLCRMSPDALLPKLKASLNSPSALMRTTVVTAMKFTSSDQSQPIDKLCRAGIGHFLPTLMDL